MRKITLFTGMLAMAAFLATTAVAQDKAKETTKPAPAQTTQKADAKAPAATDKKEACKPGCTMHKDKCCDKDKKAATTPEKK